MLFSFDPLAVTWSLHALQIAVGVVFLVHAVPKIKNPSSMAAGGFPKWFVMGLGLWEAAGALALWTGWYDQIGALMLMLVMIGATYMKIFKWKMSFKADNATGWEFDFMLFFANLAIFVAGGSGVGL